MRALLKAASQTGGGAVVAMLLTVIAGKVIAVLLGPSGVGMFVVIQQVNLTAIGLATFGGANALVQGVASREGEARNRYLVTTFWILLGSGVLASLIFVVLGPRIAPWLAGGDKAISADLFVWIALPVGLGALYSYLSGILNGFRAIGRLAVAKIVGAGTLALVAYPACLLFRKGYTVAFIWLVSSALLLQALFSFVSAFRKGWLKPIWASWNQFSGRMARDFFSIAGVLFFAAQAAGVSMLLVSALILREEGLSSVGIFSAAWSLSMNYVLLILTSFSTYYLPTLSAAKDPQECAAIIQNIFRLTMLVLVPLLTALVVFKPLVITMLYSGEFTSALSLLRWLVIANYFRVFAWVLAMPAIAFADMKVYFWTESLWWLGLLGLSALSVRGFGSVQAIGIAVIALYLAYLAYYVAYLRRRKRFMLQRRDRRNWFTGLGIVLAASIYNWSSTGVDWVSAPIWIVLAIAFSWLVLTSNERRRIVLSIKTRSSEAG